MKKFIVERQIPGAGNMTGDEIKAMSKTSVNVIKDLVLMGKPYVWIQSFITADKIYCIHEAESEEVVREHSKGGHFPINRIEEIKEIIGPERAIDQNEAMKPAHA